MTSQNKYAVSNFLRCFRFQLFRIYQSSLPILFIHSCLFGRNSVVVGTVTSENQYKVQILNRDKDFIKETVQGPHANETQNMKIFWLLAET